MLQEKTFEDIICKYPQLIEEHLKFIGRQITLYGRRMDILFEDKFKRKLIIELKAGPIKDDHIGQILSYEGMLLSADDPTIRVMLVGTRVPPNIQRSLDHHGIAWKEITFSKLKEFLLDNKDESYNDLFEFVYQPRTLGLIENEQKVRRSFFDMKQSSFNPSDKDKLFENPQKTIYGQIKEVLKDRIGSIVYSSQLKEELFKKYETNASSIILSDYCYNRLNKGIPFEKHIFEYLGHGTYKYLGENYLYTGLIYKKPQGQNNETIAGEWKNGSKILYD
jgi:hypothetical protein